MVSWVAKGEFVLTMCRRIYAFVQEGTSRVYLCPDFWKIKYDALPNDDVSKPCEMMNQDASEKPPLVNLEYQCKPFDHHGF